ncbi:hypothetical protein [Dictyobacter formicarum]|uniref:HAMP domain-containing protein n=1 Tax=Dictyobacter formicarum TaxID=2778368 RepID=A0ABQ3VCH7_9CHLR|nr:hypothetical protein [Dictyobacter formicarum]GHO83759.1 hypothetical protein KSZ_17650 [Dictyobacter formicarum]
MASRSSDDFSISEQNDGNPVQSTHNNPHVAISKTLPNLSQADIRAAAGHLHAAFSSAANHEVQLYDPGVMRSLWLEQYCGKIVAGLVLLFFAAWLLLFVSLPLSAKSSVSVYVEYASQGIGGCLALLFLLRMLGLKHRLRRKLRHVLAETLLSEETALMLHVEAQSLQAANIMWGLFTLGILLSLSGQLLWIGTVQGLISFQDSYRWPLILMYCFLYAGIVLLARKHGALQGRLRLLLDFLLISSALLILSWFFILNQLFVSMHGAIFARVLSAWLPINDIVLVVLGSVCLCGIAVSEQQEKVFLRLFWGICLLAFSDSLWSYEALHHDTHLEVIRAITNPLGLLLIALAAIKHPQMILEERQRLQQRLRSYGRQFTFSMRSTSSSLLVLVVCAILSTVIAAQGGQTLWLAIGSSFVLMVALVARQTLSLIENTRLLRQLQHALLLTQQELSEARHVIDQIAREAQEKRAVEDAIGTLRNAHAMLARGDFSARAIVPAGPLLPIAMSFNLMVERLSTLKQQTEAYEHLRNECQVLRSVVEHLSMGGTLASVQEICQKSSELRPIFLTLIYFQRQQQQQWYAQMQTMEMIKTQLQYLSDGIVALDEYSFSSPTDRLTFGRLKGTFEHLKHPLEQLKQRVEYLHVQFVTRDLRAAVTSTPPPENDAQTEVDDKT